MLEAKKDGLFENLFFIYNSFLLKRSFEKILVHVEEMPKAPYVCVLNHSSWWDGLLLFQLNKKILETDMHAMMSEKGLLSYPFFRKLGGFSINQQKPKDIIKSFSYASALLDEGRSVSIFPQGDERHLEQRPLQFLPGIAYLLERQPSVHVVPVSFYYSFGHVKKPSAYVTIGKAVHAKQFLAGTRKENTYELEAHVTEQLDHLRDIVITENYDYFTRRL
ncbi:hypothetical protein EJF36_05705 [Bacillus sp. HMF5848]|uniref:lysophospholipid acyltransferase family protein n=1 Tax=Bacillus sp. HMF5848 TaxID=2495421 RepID=UPI000F7B5852|nr:lysophospholipid acyltransferase family protein [Bacillus sp. HMF5848]RSK26393.1 hypothetical protein EJF36_05705 [Bacillus sp. HMF5848]